MNGASKQDSAGRNKEASPRKVVPRRRKSFLRYEKNCGTRGTGPKGTFLICIENPLYFDNGGTYQKMDNTFVSSTFRDDSDGGTRWPKFCNFFFQKKSAVFDIDIKNWKKIFLLKIFNNK